MRGIMGIAASALLVATAGVALAQNQVPPPPAAVPYAMPRPEMQPAVQMRQPAVQILEPRGGDMPVAPAAPRGATLGEVTELPPPQPPKTQEQVLTELTKTVETLGKKLTVVSADDNFKLVLGGAVIADFLYSHPRPVAPGTPFLLAPRSPLGFDQQTFSAHARQTTLTALIAGPKLGDFETGGVVLVNLYNDAVVLDRYGILPILAFGQLKNDDWRFAAGLQWDIFNPLMPNILPFSYLEASGNTGIFRGQARVERYLHPSCDSQVTLTGGISDPAPTSVNNNLRVNEDNGWPNIEGRAALALGPLKGEGLTAKRPFEAGFSGVVGQLRTTVLPNRVVASVWGAGADLRWAFTDLFGIQGEFFVGEALGSYAGGIFQNTNAVTFAGVHSVGGWGEFYYYLVPECLHSHLGYGIDDPLNGDLALGQPVRNETYFLNLIWDVTRYFRVGWEVTYRRTAYTLFRNNDGLTFQTQVKLTF